MQFRVGQELGLMEKEPDEDVIGQIQSISTCPLSSMGRISIFFSAAAATAGRIVSLFSVELL